MSGFATFGSVRALIVFLSFVAVVVCVIIARTLTDSLHAVLTLGIFAVVMHVLGHSAALQVYMLGVRKAVLSSARLADWERLPAMLGALDHVTASRLIDTSEMPQFAKEVFARRPPWCSVTGTPAAVGPAVMVWWRDIRFSFGVAVGASYPVTKQTLYYERLSGTVFLVAFR
jgi:hypothetical protein